MGTCVIEVTELNFEVRSVLRGRLEATMALEVTMAVKDNMHIWIMRVIKVADFKSEVI